MTSSDSSKFDISEIPTAWDAKSTDLIELTYYKMYDDEDSLAPLINDWSFNNTYNANVIVNYKQFTDFDEYLRHHLHKSSDHKQ